MPIFPPEIIEAIVSQVAVEDLPACALASRLLLPFARQRMYRSIQISFLVWYPQRRDDDERLDGKVVHPNSQVLLLATLQRCPHLGSLVREIESANEQWSGEGESMVRAIEKAYEDCLKACPNVDSITYRAKSSSWEADAVVRAILAVKPPLREFTMLRLGSNLAQEFFLAYPHIKSLGVITSSRTETYPPPAFWPAELTRLKIVVTAMKIEEFIADVLETTTTNSCQTITSLHLLYWCGCLDTPLDLSPLSALSTLTLEGFTMSVVAPLLSTCKNLERLLYQLEIERGDKSLTGFLDAVPSTVVFLALRTPYLYPMPLRGVPEFIETGTLPLLREIWIAPVRSNSWGAEVGTDEMVAACVAKGVVVLRKDWGEDDWSDR
ncbi:hypothetical protein RQP46_001495 [Phenoliferia psychrophenolica]